MPDEYISREAALKDFESCNTENPYWTPTRVKTLLLRQPAADVAEVVRCKDCKHSYRIDGAKEEYDCAKISAFAKFFPGGHFCGYGERKTDG